MNKINGIEQNEFVFSAALKINEEIIKLASQYNGKAFGKYVTDVIIPRLKDPNCLCEYVFIDLSFKTQKDLTNFHDQLKLNNLTNGVCKIVVNGMFIAYINLFVNTNKWMFDATELSYYYNNDIPVLYNELTNELDDKCFIDQLHQKITRVNNDIVNSFMLNIDKNSIVHMMNQNYLSKGWTVIFGEHELKSCITVDELGLLLNKKDKQTDLKSVLDELVTLQKQIDNLIDQKARLLSCHASKMQREINNLYGAQFISYINMEEAITNAVRQHK